MNRALNNPYAVILLATVLLSTGGAAIKSVDLSAAQIACARSGLGALALLALMPSSRRRWNRRIVLVGAALASTFVLYVHANRLTTAANTIFLQATAPVYILLLSARLLGEAPRRRDLLFMAALMLGATAFLVGLQDPLETAPNPAAGNVLAALSGLSWGLTILGLRWVQLDPASGGGVAGAAVVCGNVIACLASLPAALPVVDVAPADLVVVLYLGIVQIAVAYVLLTSALRRLRALEASLFMLLEPVLNALFAWWIHAERPNRWALAGGALILASTAAKSILDSRARV